MDKDTYNQLLTNNVTAIYRKDTNDTLRSINLEASSITDQLKISDRVEQIALKNAYITVKDHKPQFPNEIKCRLINPTKSNIGSISKQKLDPIICKIKENLNLRLLKVTVD